MKDGWHKICGYDIYEELMKDAQKSPYILEEREAKYNQIDALLWVIGDESGKPI